MKILKALVVMAGVGMLAGCASIQTASVSDFNGQKLTIDNKKKRCCSYQWFKLGSLLPEMGPDHRFN